MLKLLLALLAALGLMLLIAPKVIPVLHRLKFGQTIYDLGPKTHQVKQGTPTMGGLMFGAVTIFVTLVVPLIGLGKWNGFWDFSVGLLIVALGNMLIGFVDDDIKVVRKRNLGLIWWQKIIGQVVVSLAFSVYCYLNPYVGSSIIIPFWNVEWDLGIFYIPLMTCLLIFMVNSANLQDGLDGLLSSVTVVGTSAWSGIALLMVVAGGAALSAEMQGNLLHLALVGMALIGALLGFLRFNSYPAKIFMGDTGSMWIGGLTVGMSLLLRQPFLMLFICFTLLASSFSVIIQRIYFKVTHGKRIFKMSPIHHHFELSGMTETQVVTMYTIVEAVLCFVAVFSLRLF